MSQFLTMNQVEQLNEKHGYFQFSDAQGAVSLAFANEAVAMHERVRSAAPELLTALKELEAQMLLWTDSDLNGLMPRVRAAIVKAEGGAA